MGTIKTVSYDPSVYKLVPIKRTEAMHEAFNKVPCSIVGSHSHTNYTWDGQLETVPEVLPNVVEHSGEPIAFYKPGEKSRQDDFIFASDYPNGTISHPVALFTHPAPELGVVTVTTNEQGEVVAVTRTDEEHKILSVIWQKK